MTTLDYYETYLLKLLAETCAGRAQTLTVEFGLDDAMPAPARPGGGARIGPASSDLHRDALLSSRLTDLGVEPPKRPTAEAVRAWIHDHEPASLMDLAMLRRRDALLAAAVLDRVA